MADITKEQKQQIRTLTRRANRRIERATEGQRSALEYYVNKATGADKFSATTKGLSAEQAAAKIRDIERFLAGESSTRKGWDKIKEENVHKANETLKLQGYDLSNEELAEILEQVDTSSKKDFYKAINLVEAKKIEEGEGWEGSPDEITAAIAEKFTYQQALTKALQARATRGQN